MALHIFLHRIDSLLIKYDLIFHPNCFTIAYESWTEVISVTYRTCYVPRNLFLQSTYFIMKIFTVWIRDCWMWLRCWASNIWIIACRQAKRLQRYAEDYWYANMHTREVMPFDYPLTALPDKTAPGLNTVLPRLVRSPRLVRPPYTIIIRPY